MAKLAIIIVYSFLVSCNFSCKSQQPNVTGKYYWTDMLKISSSELTLRKDSSFVYWFQAGDLHRISSEGNWSFSLQTKEVLLNSKIQSENDIIQVEENRSHELPQGTKRISIFDSNNQPYFGYIIINPSSRNHVEFSEKDFVRKSILIKDSPINEVAINYYELGSQTLFYKVKDSLANDIAIHPQINSSRNYRFFKNQRWLLRSNKLIDKDTSFNRNGQRVYVKS